MAKQNRKTGKKQQALRWKSDSGSHETLQGWMVSRLAEELKVPPAEINISMPLTSLGLDSITAFTLTGELADRLGRDLPATLFWDYPTLELLATHLDKELASPHFDNGGLARIKEP